MNAPQQQNQVIVVKLTLPLVNAIREYLGECKEKEVRHMVGPLDFEVSQQLNPRPEPTPDPEEKQESTRGPANPPPESE